MGTHLVSTAVPDPRSSQNPDKSDQRFVLWVSGLLVVSGLVVLGLFTIGSGYGEHRVKLLGAGGLLAGASFTTGCVLGLLFGIPRPQPDGDATSPKLIGTNTNLIQISDWLTKALVGVSLTKLLEIPGMLRRFGEHYGPAVGSGPVAVFLLVHFGASGFLSGYLLTRVILQQAFHRADQAPSMVTKPSDDSSTTPSDSNARVIPNALGVPNTVAVPNPLSGETPREEPSEEKPE